MRSRLLKLSFQESREIWTNGKFLLFPEHLPKEEKKLPGWHHSEPRIKSTHQQWVNMYRPPGQDSNWVLWGSETLRKDFYNFEMVFSNSQTEEREYTYNRPSRDQDPACPQARSHLKCLGPDPYPYLWRSELLLSGRGLPPCSVILKENPLRLISSIP